MSDVSPPTRLEKKVAHLLKQGKLPTIVLPPSARHVKPKRPRGRPRKYPVGADEAYGYVGRRGKSRPVCMAKGCNTRLKIHQVVTCSDACADQLFNYAISILQKLGVKKTELLEQYEDPIPPKSPVLTD